MHFKNPFSKDYNFDSLCSQLPELKSYVFTNEFGNRTIPFSDKKAVKFLNKALLKTCYNVEWEIPEGNLCPPIPGRLDYLLHIKDLIDKETIHLLDIGTGANLIYPILGTCHFDWKCTASEVDLNSLKNAQQLILENKLLKSIDLRQQKYKTKIFDTLIRPQDFFDVVVCNPPFFKNSLNAQQSNQRKARNLDLTETNTLNFGGQSNELWYKGGEEAFVKKMAEESAQFKNQVRWFTSLVSRKEHLKIIKRFINKTKPTEVRIIDMEQGNKKSRFVAWTFL